MLTNDKVAGVTYLSSGMGEIEDMLNSLNMVVLVMIICAAALAFVVLYNLTNINIAERVREIATFKVLDFTAEKPQALFIKKISCLLSEVFFRDLFSVFSLQDLLFRPLRLTM